MMTFVFCRGTKLCQVCFIPAKSVLINDWQWPDIIMYLYFLKTLEEWKPVQTCFEDLRKKLNVLCYGKKWKVIATKSRKVPVCIAHANGMGSQ